MFTITIDGPSASGKSTVADLVAQKLNMHHLNSGDFYRAVAYFMNKNNINYKETNKVNENLENLNIKVDYIDGVQHTFVNDIDVTDKLHSNEINAIVSFYGKNPNVIDKVSELTLQATFSKELVIDGRNVGSYVLPNAECKIYLDCDAKVRAERRFLEAQSKGDNVTFEEIYKQTLERDELDRTRPIAPLIIPNNAYILDSSTKNQEEVADEIIEIATEIKQTV